MKWTRINRVFPLPDYVKAAIEKLDRAGFVAYVVGGSVRDFFLGREPKDHDIATSATPDEICELFPDAITVGKAFGVIKVPLKTGGSAGTIELEIATFRTDLEYEDGRHPKGVRFTGPYDDACRRDFTVNALYYDLKNSRVLDVTGGLDDIKNRTLKAIGDPAARFKEDALRLLRAVRFTTGLGFVLDQATADAARSKAKLLQKVSPERVSDELTQMWLGPDPAESLELLSKLRLLGQVLGEVEMLHSLKPPPMYSAVGDVWRHTVRVVHTLAAKHPKRNAELMWAGLLFNLGKPAAFKKSEGKSFFGHEVEASRIARLICERLKMSREQVDRVAALVNDQLRIREVFQMREATLQRLVREPHFEDLLALHQADAICSSGNLAYHDFCKDRFEAFQRTGGAAMPKILDGKDLLQLGFVAGPKFSEILSTVDDLALEGKLTSKEAALEYVLKHFVK